MAWKIIAGMKDIFSLKEFLVLGLEDSCCFRRELLDEVPPRGSIRHRHFFLVWKRVVRERKKKKKHSIIRIILILFVFKKKLRLNMHTSVGVSTSEIQPIISLSRY